MNSAPTIAADVTVTLDDAVAKALRAKISSVWVKIGDGAQAFANIKGTTADLFRSLPGALLPLGP